MAAQYIYYITGSLPLSTVLASFFWISVFLTRVFPLFYTIFHIEKQEKLCYFIDTKR